MSAAAAAPEIVQLDAVPAAVQRIVDVPEAGTETTVYEDTDLGALSAVQETVTPVEV